MKTDLEIQGFIIGITCIIIVVKILKRTLRLPRPIMEEISTYGMPSTRAASLVFIISYIVLTSPGISHKTIGILIVAVLVCCGIKFCMKEHSLLQLSMGGILGLIGAIIVHRTVKYLESSKSSKSSKL